MILTRRWLGMRCNVSNVMSFGLGSRLAECGVYGKRGESCVSKQKQHTPGLSNELSVPSINAMQYLLSKYLEVCLGKVHLKALEALDSSLRFIIALTGLIQF